MQNVMPLVSIPVVTYNSAETIVETLDSIYNQTYPNIELIVSDDASRDNTVETVKEWLEIHKDRFVRTELITISANKGVTANYNRSAAACKGEWVKDMDGDDILLPNCVQTYMDYVTEHPEAICVFSKMRAFRGDGEGKKIVPLPLQYDFFNWPIDEQYHFLIFIDNQIPAPACLYNRQRVQDLDITNDERIPMMEDWPKWVNYLKKGVHFDFIDDELVMYRLSESSISNSQVKSDSYSKSLALFFIYYQFADIWKEDKPRAIVGYVSAKTILTKKWYWRYVDSIFKYLIKTKKKVSR